VNRFRMHERDLEPEHAAPRARVDQLDAGVGERVERDLDVVDLEGDVMHPLPALGEEPTDGRVVAERCEQLDPALAEAHRRRLDALVLDALAMLESPAEEALVRLHRRIEVLDGDADVMDRSCVHRGDATAACGMLAAMGRRVLLATVAVAAVAGCGGGSSNGEAKKGAEQVVKDAHRAALSARSVHVTGAITDEGKPLTLDLVVVKGKGGKGTLSENGLKFDLIRVRDAVYIRGSDAFIEAFAGAGVVPLLHGKWLKGSATSGALAALAPLTDNAKLFEGALGNHGKLANKGEAEFQGQKVVEIDDTTEGGKLYVAAEGDPFPVALRGAKEQGHLTFTDWDDEADVSAPKGAVDMAKLGK
jgi:hypothetical protein